jgi:hypothetical protein
MARCWAYAASGDAAGPPRSIIKTRRRMRLPQFPYARDGFLIAVSREFFQYLMTMPRAVPIASATS